MADDQADLTAAKAHSTFGQAIEVGRFLNAENVLLTHFLACYPGTPKMVGEGKEMVLWLLIMPAWGDVESANLFAGDRPELQGHGGGRGGGGCGCKCR